MQQGLNQNYVNVLELIIYIKTGFKFVNTLIGTQI